MTISEFIAAYPAVELACGKRLGYDQYIIIKTAGMLFGSPPSWWKIWPRRPKMTISNFLKENPDIEVTFGTRSLYYVGELWRVVDNGSALREKSVVLDTMDEEQAVAMLAAGYEPLVGSTSLDTQKSGEMQ